MTVYKLTSDQLADLGEAVGKIATYAARALHCEYPHLDLEGLVEIFTRDSALEMIAVSFLDGLGRGMPPGEAAGETVVKLIHAWADARLEAHSP